LKIDLRKYGYLRVGSLSPEMRIGDISYNTASIIKSIEKADIAGCQLLVTPELSITGYSCGDLFFQQKLLKESTKALVHISQSSTKFNLAVIIGLPLMLSGRIYNCAAYISNGEIKGIVPKTYLPNTNEYYEARWFASSLESDNDLVRINGRDVPFGADLLFCDEDYHDLMIGIEICEDLWSVIPPSSYQAIAGGNVLVNLSASNEILGKSEYRRELVKNQSGRCLSAYIYSSSGKGESSTDLAFSGHCMIYENGLKLNEREALSNGDEMIIADIDLERLNSERAKNMSYRFSPDRKDFRLIDFRVSERKGVVFNRQIKPNPFVPNDKTERSEVCRMLFSIQAAGLIKRFESTGLSKAVIGLSGGLDSTLALLAVGKAFIKLGLNKKNIVCVSMPGFGTSRRTKNNAKLLAKNFGCQYREVPITESVTLHLKDIGHDGREQNITYENAQARERTQILFDIANMENGLVIGTSDLSEQALGWSTYGGDHISMYNVNAGIPKTLVRYIVEWCSEEEFSGKISKVLKDICETPISPELLPPDIITGKPQSTEDSVGPYELHDFFLYYFFRYGFNPDKILMLAETAFKGHYKRQIIRKWLQLFYKRFFANQFKRSCTPDTVKAGTVALSPRGDWRMPSDISPILWLRDLE
jgi:NAD+ synthase (glutamine-hydrolysing)